ncbi:hypothetical protein I4Q36_08920 [Tuanshanicoccus lijuaniae]|uniref:hypothetical protein n=1 Tax=Aerococcaceae bacterium zg-1292 TaxID=2774330 RepID=UPI001938F9CD|nr:hypothetical protein [Aerococcaceae bacterium zg-1292]QQA36901.1 hypothetical protein I4Q36_08920 [Aerococcaceae bacterium zg-1292]
MFYLRTSKYQHLFENKLIVSYEIVINPGIQVQAGGHFRPYYLNATVEKMMDALKLLTTIAIRENDQ